MDQMRIARPDRLGLLPGRCPRDGHRQGERRGGRGAGRRECRPRRREPERSDADSGEQGERRNELQVVVRMEIAAAEDPQHGGAEPDSGEERRAPPAGSREQSEHAQRLARGR